MILFTLFKAFKFSYVDLVKLLTRIRLFVLRRLSV